MFTSPLANKHFDFSAPFIQLPMIHPVTDTTTTQEDDNDITMTEPAVAAADDHGALVFMDSDQEMSLWKAAHTLLDLHNAVIHHAVTHHQSDTSTCSSPTVTTIASSSTDSQEDLSESSSNSSSSVAPRTRQRQPQQQQRHTPTTTTASGAIAKPRWSDEERTKLLMAVVEAKGLHQLTTFDWQRVASSVRNQTSTTCCDRWRDHLLPVILQLYQPISNSSSGRGSSSSTSSSPL